MSRKQRAQSQAKGLADAQESEVAEILESAVNATESGLAPWEKPKPWDLSIPLARDLERLILESANPDPDLVAALVSLRQIVILTNAEMTGKTKADLRERRNLALMALWGSLCEQLDLLTEKHSLPLYKAYRLSKEQ